MIENLINEIQLIWNKKIKSNEKLYEKAKELLSENSLSEIYIKGTQEKGLLIGKNLILIRAGRKFCPIHDVPIILKKKELNLDKITIVQESLNKIHSREV